MKNLKLIYAVIAIIILSVSACKKTRKDDTSLPSPIVSAKDFIAANGPQTQNFKIKGNVSNTFTLKGGTVITIPAGAINAADGTVANDEIAIEAMEFLNRSDVLFGGANTNYISGAPLASDGFIYLNAKINGVTADKALNAAVKISIPAKRTGSTQIWEGVENVGATNQFAWQEPVQIQPKAIVNAGAFTFDMGNLGWINCDIFFGLSNPKTTTRVSIANNPGSMATFRAFSGETFVFFCAKGSNVAVQIYTPDGANKVKSYNNMMPIGVEGKYLSFSIKDGKFYYAEQETTIVANQNISLTLTETTEAKIQAAITSLNTY